MFQMPQIRDRVEVTADKPAETSVQPNSGTTSDRVCQ